MMRKDPTTWISHKKRRKVSFQIKGFMWNILFTDTAFLSLGAWSFLPSCCLLAFKALLFRILLLVFTMLEIHFLVLFTVHKSQALMMLLSCLGLSLDVLAFAAFWAVASFSFLLNRGYFIDQDTLLLYCWLIIEDFYFWIL